MTFTSPFWLLLLIPLAGALWLYQFPSRLLQVVRSVIALLLLLALAGLSVELPSRSGCVVVVADRSRSMPEGSTDRQTEMARLLHHAMGPEDELAVVSFGQQVAVEQPPERVPFRGFVNEVGEDSSNLAEAIERAVSLIPSHRPGRILVLSDGYATGRDLAMASAQAASAGIAIDYRPLQRGRGGDLAIERIDAPSSVAAAEAFMISASIQSPRPQRVHYELVRGDQRISSGEIDVPQGTSRILFRDQAGDAGARSYSLQIRPVSETTSDPIPENNSARFLVGVRGIKPLLCLGPPESSLPGLLTAGGIKVDQQDAESVNWSLAELAGYTAVLLENVPANDVGMHGMQTLASWVTETGGGLMMTGGQNTFGSGGYFKSDLEPILPVSMELRREHRKLSLAIVVALDRSGSMAMTVPGGRSKMELANLATAEVLNQLSGQDQFGCLAVDSVAHEIIPLSGLENKARMTEKILRIESMGGGIFVYEALEKAAAMVASATAGTRHIILFSDAADSEQPGNYQDLLEKCVKAGITVSVIGLGSETDSDANLLKDIAARGDGRCLFTTDANELPRLFAQDTFLVSRSTFVDEPTAIRTTPDLSLLTTQSWEDFPQVGGFNLCYLRPEASLGAVTQDEYKAPLVASWQAGAGRVLCFTGEADGQFTGPLGNWPRVGEFFSSLARWVSSQEQGLGSEMLLTQELRNGTAVLELHLDSERASTPFSKLPEITVLREIPGQQPAAERVPLNWTSADVLSTTIPLTGSETLMASLEIPGVGRTTLPPVCLPYSAEYAPRRPDEGLQTLQNLARATGGKERINLAEIWQDLPRQPKLVSLAPWLLIVALVVLLGEIFQRRTGLLSIQIHKRQTTAETMASNLGRKTDKRKPGKTPRASAPTAAGTGASPQTEEGSQKTPPATKTQDSNETQAPSVLDALSQARSRAARRTKR